MNADFLTQVYKTVPILAPPNHAYTLTYSVFKIRIFQNSSFIFRSMFNKI